MGCCQGNLETGEVAAVTDVKPTYCEERMIKTEEGFSDMSLDSHQTEKLDQLLDTSKSHLCESLIYFTRSTSISLHRADLESAFLHSGGQIKCWTLDLSRIPDHLE